MRARKKPIEVEYVRWDGNASTANAFIGERYFVDWEFEQGGRGRIIIPTLEGKMTGDIGDLIIKGVNGSSAAA